MATRPKRKDNLREEAAQGDEATSIVPIEHVQSRILVIRGQKVILDSDLAKLYGVTTGRLNEQVKRNLERFPPDFAFRLTEDEFTHLKSHFATSSSGWGGRRKLPYAFTEHRAVMAASVLNSERAVQVSVFVVRAFVRLKQMLEPYKELAAKLDRLEQKVQDHDQDIVAIVEAIRLLMPPPDEPKEPFGFRRAKKNRTEGVPDPVSCPVPSIPTHFFLGLSRSLPHNTHEDPSPRRNHEDAMMRKTLFSDSKCGASPTQESSKS